MLEKMNDLAPLSPTEQIFLRFHEDWNYFIRDILGVRLDNEQQEIVHLVQHNRRTSVRSGHSRGKDYVAAAISLTFLNIFYPSKVILTAPSGRQVQQILMAEVSSMYNNSKVALGGTLLQSYIKMPHPNWYLMGFKTSDRKQELWTGFHSPYILVIVSEASGVTESAFTAIDGLMTGTVARLLLVFNPTMKVGEAYNSTKNPNYVTYKMNCLDAVNVREKRIVIPGQVDYNWVNDMVHKPGLCCEISKEEFSEAELDFEWEGKLYRPSDIFRIKVLGEFPKTSEGALIPLEWIELANERYNEKIDEAMELVKKYEGTGNYKDEEERKEYEKKKHLLKKYYSVDVAGMGRDLTVITERIRIPEYNIIHDIYSYAKQDHMVTVGKAKNIAEERGGMLLIDAEGEGAGVDSRLRELGVSSIGVKFSESAKGLSDVTGYRTFANMRAYVYWALRDALDPSNEIPMLLPFNAYLTQDITEPMWKFQSNGDIILEPKDDIKARIGHSPDFGDSLSQSFYPYTSIDIAFL